MSPQPRPDSNRQHYMARRPMKWWYESIIDDMLASPLDTVAQRAKRLGYTPAGLQMILGSDMFKAAYGARRRNYTELLDATLIHKTAKLAEKGLDLLLEQMESKRTQLPFQALSEAVIGPNGALARLGYGAKSGPSTIVQVNNSGGAGAVIQQVSAEDLAAARARLRQTESSLLMSPGRSPDPTHSRLIEAEVLPSVPADTPAEGPPPGGPGGGSDA